MDSANLAICFAPNLLRQEVDDLTSIINTGKQSSIIDTLIEQQEWVFNPYPEEDDEGEQQALQLAMHHTTNAPVEADEEYEVVVEEEDGHVRSGDLELEKGGEGDDQEAHLHLQKQLLQEQQDEIYRQHEHKYRQDEQFCVVDKDLQGHYEQQQLHPHHSSLQAEVPSVSNTTTTAAPISSSPTYTDLCDDKSTSGSKDPFWNK
jgi:hypothetical protein